MYTKTPIAGNLLLVVLGCFGIANLWWPDFPILVDLEFGPINTNKVDDREVEFARTFLGNCAFPRPENEHLCSDLCSEFTPECLELEELTEVWGWTPPASHKRQPYSRNMCCHNHGMGRIVGMQVLPVLQDMNLTTWMDGGSALGMVRHNGTIIPWDDDLDIAVLMHRNESDKESLLGLPSVHYHELGQVAKRAKNRLNHLWDSNSLKHYNATPLTNYTVNVKLKKGTKAIKFPGTVTSQIKTGWWLHEEPHKNDFCHQQQLKLTVKHNINGNEVESFTFTADLFGYMPDLDQPRRKVAHQGSALDVPSVRTGGCFEPFAKSGIEASYMMFPPLPCEAPFCGNPDIPVFCPRDDIGYLKAYFGDKVMENALSHNQFYDDIKAWRGKKK